MIDEIKNILNDEDNFNAEVYFNCLVSIAYADGILEDSEREYIENQAAIMDFSVQEIIKQPKKLESIDFDSLSTLMKNTIIRDCISLSRSCGLYRGLEKETLLKIADRMSISGHKVEEIENWLSEYSELIQRGQSIMESK
jgi:uncharacterized membrane protein YebE (DUF533 family)